MLAVGDAKIVDIAGTAHQGKEVRRSLGKLGTLTTEPLQQRALTWWSTYQIYG